MDCSHIKNVTRALIILLLFSAQVVAAKQKLVIFHAGSLSVPFKNICESFAKQYKDVLVIREAAGSRMCARKIVDIGLACDVFASSDYTVIDTLLIPNYADWNIKFAANEIVIAYTEHSRRSDEINSRNWYEILLDDNVAFGRSDPNSDPCGYRAVFCVKLAQIFFKQPSLAEKILKKDNRYIRPKEVDLLALLEVGQIDYIFIYKSVAIQHGLKILSLPEQINLSNENYKDFYRKATIRLSGRKREEFIVKEAEPIVYGVTIPKNSPSPELARQFVEFLLEEQHGLSILEKAGQKPIVPAVTESYDNIPFCLRKYAIESTEEAGSDEK